ncbi:MAG: tryptophan--tRNA ligase [Candidatus Dojkabacteria bacterium]|jgi:tryptophanyl-tRNA synthetase
MENIKERKRILTGDRPSGKLHIGHLIGSIQNRVKLADEYESFIEIANVQAIADNFDNPGKVRESVLELLCDYYASGIDFEKSTVFIQSEVPEIHEIFIYLANFTTVQKVQHNPTIKTEMAQKGYTKSTPLGFFLYPVHQAADILSVNADLVPAGKDQSPMVEDTREIVKKFNATYGVDFFHYPEVLIGSKINIPGIDGAEKMGKSLNNGIYLSDSEEELRKKVFKVYTDPNRIHATDPGKVEGNVAFVYHDYFNEDKEEVEDMKKRYREGKIKDVEVKERLFEVMNETLTPIRNRRIEAESMKDELLERALEGSKRVSDIAKETVDLMKEAMLLKFK